MFYKFYTLTCTNTMLPTRVARTDSSTYSTVIATSALAPSASPLGNVMLARVEASASPFVSAMRVLSTCRSTTSVPSFSRACVTTLSVRIAPFSSTGHARFRRMTCRNTSETSLPVPVSSSASSCVASPTYTEGMLPVNSKTSEMPPPTSGNSKPAAADLNAQKKGLERNGSTPGSHHAKAHFPDTSSAVGWFSLASFKSLMMSLTRAASSCDAASPRAVRAQMASKSTTCECVPDAEVSLPSEEEAAQ
mmetsp:Transcript_843/g.1854  ORF Transcript_843/g.1854 Transcript_843/m.1854 type:complete len:249 (+) Transcript_843:22-768(+)